jgi:hypothetical protein
LLSLNSSTATFNPAYHPQQAGGGHHYQQEDYMSHSELQPPQPQEQPPRGGSTMVYSEPPPPEEEVFHPPKIHLKHMAMALRLTSEWNRRLLNGIKRVRLWGQKKQPQQQQQQKQQHHPQQGYGSHPVNVHPSRSWHPPIREAQPEEEELTLFHAKAPRGSSSSQKKQRRGVARWGPELLPYLEHVVDLLGIHTDGAVEIPLAMIYLDRACSVETPRSNGVPPCPFCTPRTVHRLSVVALLLATQAVHGDESMSDHYEKLQESLGISSAQLRQMVDWMRGALGNAGLYVNVGQMKDWSQTWNAIFFPKKQQRLQQQQQQQYIEEPIYHHPSQIEASNPHPYTA